MALLEVRVQKNYEQQIKAGYPWVMAHMIEENSSLVVSTAGELATITNHQGKYLATGYYNRASMISARVLTQDPNEKINSDFFKKRFETALAARKAKYDVPFYRLVHSEGDGLPGLVVDRFEDILVCQVSTAGMDRLQPLWMPVLDAMLMPVTIVMRNDIPARDYEKLTQEVKVIKGEMREPAPVEEYGVRYEADVLKGQKTGWFYDQRENRHWVAERAKGKSVLDVCCYSGGFGVAAAKAGATEVTFVDSSELALVAARNNMLLNQLRIPAEYIHEKAYDALARLAREGKKYDIVLLDPPAFVKRKQDKAVGLKGYEKMARLAAPLVKKGGMVFEASCSHHAPRAEFFDAVRTGIKMGKRTSEVLRRMGAAPDHPVHPMLPENDYLKAIALKLD